MAVKASPTVFVLNFHVHSTGNASAKVPKLNTIALKKMKDSSCTIRRGVLNFSSLLLSLVSPKYFAFWNRLTNA
jgi:hypothetical protein